MMASREWIDLFPPQNEKPRVHEMAELHQVSAKLAEHPRNAEFSARGIAEWIESAASNMSDPVIRVWSSGHAGICERKDSA